MRGLKETSQLRVKFGNRIRELRSEVGFTQERLAEEVGISVDFLSLVERGKSSPSFESLEQLAAALGVSIAHLFSFEEKSHKAE